jgi:phosphoglucosamine mutase
VVDGDELLCIIALHTHRQGTLKGGVVGTLMSNLGLEQALKEKQIPFVRTKVGDRYVAKALRDNGWLLGGESSGHLLILTESCTGDGIVAALQVMQAMCREQRSLGVLKQGMSKCPQVMINVPCHKKWAIDSNSQIQKAVCQVENTLGALGRVLLRQSGTEPVVRVMVEGTDANQVQKLAEQLAQTVKQVIGEE